MPNITKTKIKPTSKDDLYDALEGAMASIRGVMDDLRGIPEYEVWYLTMEQTLDEMKAEFEPLEAWASQEYQNEIDALNRQYLRDRL